MADLKKGVDRMKKQEQSGDRNDIVVIPEKAEKPDEIGFLMERETFRQRYRIRGSDIEKWVIVFIVAGSFMLFLDKYVERYTLKSQVREQDIMLKRAFSEIEDFKTANEEAITQIEGMIASGATVSTESLKPLKDLLRKPFSPLVEDDIDVVGDEKIEIGNTTLPKVFLS